MHRTNTGSSNTFSPPPTSMTTIPRAPPGVVTYRYQHDKGSEMAYVALADSHEEAQVAATRALAALADVDPRWLSFTITIRYRKSNEKQEIVIAPGAWGYVTRRLVPYRLIDVRVVPPTPSAPPPASPSKSLKSLAPPYPDTPPPRYPGSPRKHVPLPPEDQGYGYGYGYGWRDQPRAHRNDFSRATPQLDPGEMADRRSMGWSAGSVKFEHTARRPGLFGRFKQNGFGIFPIFPITWDDQVEDRRYRREKGRSRRLREKDRERMRDRHDEASGSGHSYVPSLI